MSTTGTATTAVAVGGGTGVAVGGTGVAVGVGGTGVGVGAKGNAGNVRLYASWIPGPPRNNRVSVAAMPVAGMWGYAVLGTI